MKIWMTWTLTAPISGLNPAQLLEKIVSDQRDLLKQVYNTSDVSTIPQVWTLCNSYPSCSPRCVSTDAIPGAQTRKSRATTTRASRSPTMLSCSGLMISAC